MTALDLFTNSYGLLLDKKLPLNIQPLRSAFIFRNVLLKEQDALAYFDEDVVSTSAAEQDQDYLTNTAKKLKTLLKNCRQANVDYSTVLKDLGVTVPEQVFSEQFLTRIFNEIFQDLARSTETRLKIPHLSTLNQLINLFRFSTRIIFLIGAGASVAAGIPDFRSANGVYSRLSRFNLKRPTDMFDLAFFKENPLPFFNFCPEIVP